MTVWLVGLLVFLSLWLARRARDRKLAAVTTVTATELDGESRGVPRLASIDHLLPRREAALAIESPYRRSDFGRTDPRRTRARNRARAALLSARWLLGSAIDEAAEAERLRQRGALRAAAQRSLAQTTAESEALQCIFEAEELLGTRIVRDPGQLRCLAPFYGQAARLLALVTEHCERLLGPRTAPTLPPAFAGLGDDAPHPWARPPLRALSSRAR